MTIYVIAPRRRDGLAWLRAHGLTETRAVLVSCSGFSGADRLAGRHITLGDRVVQLPGWRDGFNAPAVSQALVDARGLWCAECGQLIPPDTEHDDHEDDCPNAAGGLAVPCGCDRPVHPACCRTCQPQPQEAS